MRRILIPLVFVVLLTIAAVMPVTAGSGTPVNEHVGCDYST